MNDTEATPDLTPFDLGPSPREVELTRVQRLARVGGFEIDLTGGTMRNRRSPEYLRIHGLDASAVGETHDDWVRRLHPDDRIAAEAHIKAVVAGRDTEYAAEYRIITADGEVRWIAAVGEIERAADGSAVRMIGAHTDITRLKRAEAAVRAGEVRWRALFDGMQEGFFVAEMIRDARGRAQDFRFIEVNPAFETLTGIPAARAIGRSVRETIPGVQLDLVEFYGDIARTGRSAQFELTVAALGGRCYEVRAHGVEGDRFAALFIEITARKQVEAALRESQDRLALAQDAAGIGIWEWDIASDLTSWSARNFMLWGWPLPTPVPTEESVIATEKILAAIHPADQPRVRDALAAAVTERGSFRCEFRVASPNGDFRWIAAAGRFIEPTASHAQGRLIGVNLDVTAEYHARAELERLNDELACRVREAVAAREDTQSRLVHALRVEALGQLAGGIAHDFNNVLQAVQGALALIERRPQDVAAVTRFARLALDTTRRGASVTNRLLAYARREESVVALLDVPQILVELSEILPHTLGSHIAVRLEIGEAVPWVRAEKGQLETALINLAVNSRDAMPDGGVLTFVARAVARSVPRGVADGVAPGDDVLIQVIDDGAGMDAATLARTRDPFFTTKPAGRGTGLGLATARAFAEQAGGGMEIESAPGRGTTVSIRLPAIPRDAACPAPTVLSGN